MTLTRKTRLSGSSIVVTIPSQITEAYDIKIGDVIEITPLNSGEIRIKKSIKKTNCNHLKINKPKIIEYQIVTLISIFFNVINTILLLFCILLETKVKINKRNYKINLRKFKKNKTKQYIKFYFPMIYYKFNDCR